MIRKVLNWFDNNILSVLAGFLLVFIPLYPKWPMFDILYGYNVRVRLEDFFVALTAGVLFVWILRRKVKLNRDIVSLGLIAYLVIGLLSVLTALFIIQTIPLQYLFVAKTFLHWLRRAEYFSLFFVFLASIKSFKQVKVYLVLFFLTFLAVIIYGYGQKYLYWPAFSTMNREYAKGWWLYLTGSARVLSTFGGHYDLAAYLVIALTLAWSFFFGLKKLLPKIAVGLLIAGGFWLLILTASRASFGGYMVGLIVVVALWTLHHNDLRWGVNRLLITVSLSVVVMLSFGDLSDRFLTLIRASERFSGVRSVLLLPFGLAPTKNAVFLENNIAAVTSKSDQPPLPKPSDVTGNEMPLLLPQKTASGATILVPQQRNYSQNALLYDLSTGIRLDATWPQAINGFKMDPLFGKGYATLTEANKYDFTQGESTDNDFLRALGETGLLGFLSFFGTLAVMGVFAYKALGGIRDSVLFALTAGFIGLVLGLLVNAIVIDVFEASKVAYVFWGVSGMTMASLYLNREKIRNDMKPFRLDIDWKNWLTRMKKFLVSDVPYVALFLLLLVVLRGYKFNEPVADWQSWRQADTSAVTRQYWRYHKVNLFLPTYDDLSSIPSGKPNPAGLRLVEFPIYNAVSYGVRELMPEWTVEEAGRAVTILSNVFSLVFIFLLCRKYFSRRVAYLAAFMFAAIPYNIYYGRVILPDPSMVATGLGALWYGSEYISRGKKRYFVLTLVLAIASLLIKPYGVFFLLPLAYLWLVNMGISRKSLIALGVLLGLAALPMLAWRLWISRFPEGVPASDWLYNGDGIRFKGAFWYWLFADRIGREIMGYWGLILVGVGLLRKNLGKNGWFAIILFLSSLLYLTVFATGNVRHDYYQILIFPSLAILSGLGLDFLIGYNWRGKLLALICLLFTLGFGWYFIRGLYNINHPEIVAAGQAVKTLTDWRTLVVAPYDGDTAFLYQTDRRGWPIMEGNIDQMIAKGAQYYVSVKFDDLTKQLLSQSWPKGQPIPLGMRPKYKLLAYTDQYAIIQLVPDSDLPQS